MSRVTHQPTGSIPVLVLPYTVVPPGAAPYEYEANIALANRNLGFVERVTPLLARLAWTTVERPSFDGVQSAEAVLRAMSQADFMTAAAGADKELWREGVGVFTPGTPLASDAGMEPLAGPRSLDAARRALAARVLPSPGRSRAPSSRRSGSRRSPRRAAGGRGDGRRA